MALGAALTCFVFYRNHKNRTYKRNLKDLIQEFDINQPFGRVASAQIGMKACRQTAAFLVKLC